MKTPTSFFKFVSKDRIDLIKNGTIRFTQPTLLNDPFEINPEITHHTRDWVECPPSSIHLEWSDEDYDFSIERHSRIQEKRNEFSETANKIVILSLSASYDTSPNPAIFIGHENDPRRNLLMWAHYCDSHSGFVVEFSPEFVDGECKPVEYTENRPIYTFEDIDGCGFGSLSAYVQKSNEWAYENEWRIFNKYENAVESSTNEVRLFKFRKSCVRSVTFGCNASEETVSSVVDILRSDPEYHKVATYFARVSNHRFELQFHQQIYDGKRCWTNAPEFQAHSITIQRKPK